MQELSSMELEAITGGVTLSGTLINSFATIIKVLVSIGHDLGSAIRRMSERQICPLK